MISFESVIESFKQHKIELAGAIPFSDVENKLLPCAAQKRLPENAKTVILCLFPYAVKKEPPKTLSRYAAVPDYHKVCGEYLNKTAESLKSLFPLNRFEAFIDNSPIPEVFAAAKAGLGVIGENGLLINKKYGSFVFIGEIVTDLELETKDFNIEKCISCKKCETACPVGLKKDKCLSFLSQKKGELGVQEAKALKDNNILWGCDKCAEVCPQNRYAETYIPEFTRGYKADYLPTDEIEGRAFSWRGKKTIDRNYVNLKQDSKD